MSVASRYEAVSRELERVCAACGRLRGDVRLVAVSKTVGADAVAEAMGAGARDFGENRPNQLMQKADVLCEAHWHFIGNIQSRRIRDIVGRASLIHSLYQWHHAVKIDEAASALGIAQDVLLEVNVSGEQSKSGLAPDEVAGMLSSCQELSHLRVRGLMTMAPIADEQTVRATFSGLRDLRDELAGGLPEEAAARFTELSMGMSDDWRIAVEEGATIVRVGRAIFSETY